MSLHRDLDPADWWRDELRAIVREDVGLSDASADEIADLILVGMRRRNGGREIYVPAPDLKKRDAEIRASFNGQNMHEVCRAYGVSKSTVYRVCRKQNAPGKPGE